MTKVTKIDSQRKSEVVIDGTVIRQDAEGRYCLNDFHHAAGGHNKHRPSIWMRNAKVNSLIHQLIVENTSANPVSVRKGRNVGGTYVARELVYSYAMWIGPSYHLKAMRALDRGPSADRQTMSTSAVEVKVAKDREPASGRFDLSYARTAVEYKPSPAAFIQGEALSMSSNQISDLVGSRHEDVRRSIDRLVDRGVIEAPPMAELKAQSGQTSKSYIFQGEQGKRDSIIVVAQLSPEFTAKLVDRWQELEAEVAKPAPANLNDAAALRGLLLGYTEKVMELEHQVGIQAEKIAEDKPKADYYAHVRDSKNTETIGDFAKVLGFGRNKLFAWLRDQNILMHNNMPQQKHIDQGHFRVLDKDYTSDKGNKVTYKQTVLTGKGKTYVQKRLKKAGNPDLGEDD